MMNSYTTTFTHQDKQRNNYSVDITSPLDWLQRSWNDLAESPVVGLLIGGMFTLLCLAAYAAITVSPLLSATSLALLLLASPFIAAAAYSISRQQAQLPSASLRDAVYEVRKRALGIGLFAVTCALIVGAWVRLSSIVFAFYYGSLEVDAAAELARAWTAGSGYPTLLMFVLLSGAVLGTILFAIGVLALPMIAEKDTDIVSAIGKSLRTLRAHPMVMFVWVSFIIGAIGLALLSGLVLMPLVFPLLAYASWHGYRQLSQAGDNQQG